MRPSIKKPLAKGLVTTADNSNFKTKDEIIKDQWDEILWIEQKHRYKRFEYYFDIFDLSESLIWDEPTEKQIMQYSLIWKLVDMEGIEK
jgi:hypothetical protein